MSLLGIIGLGFGSSGAAVVVPPPVGGTPFQSAENHGFTAMLSIAGRQVIYRRGGTDVVLTMIPARTEYDVRYDEIGVTQQHLRDWLCYLNALGAHGEPERYDDIVDGAVTYEVLSVGGVAQFSYMDHDRTMLRIHTREK